MGTIDARNGAAAGQHRGALPRSVQRRHLEPRGDLADHADLHASASATSTSTLYSPKFGSWVQDDWQISIEADAEPRAAVRPELDAFANDVSCPAVPAGRTVRNDTNNIQPRVGFAYTAERRDGDARRHRAVLRRRRSAPTSRLPWRNRPDRASSSTPTTAGRTSRRTRSTASRCRPTSRRCTRFCYVNNNAPGLSAARRCQELVGAAGVRRTCRARWQTSIGFQRQIGTHDGGRGRLRLHARARDEKDVVDNINLTFNPATGVNLSVRDVAPTAPYPGLGRRLDERAHRPLRLSRAADAFTKRFSNRWQGSATYTLSGLWNADTQPFSGLDAGAVPGRAGPRRRVGAVGRRPAPSRGVQRHLAGRPRLPGERAALLRRRHPAGAPTTAATCAASARRRQRSACVRTARSFRATTSSQPRAEPDGPPAPAADSAAGPAVDRRDRGSVQRVQPPNWTIRTQESSTQFCSRRRAEPHGAVGFRLTF